MPEILPAQIACLGWHLLELLNSFDGYWPAGAIDSTLLCAKGGVWHKKDREAGVVPHTSIDTKAHWGKSGWHGWVYGWKLHLGTTVAYVWIPLTARLTPANAADNELAPALLEHVPAPIPFLLRDTQYNDPELCRLCESQDRVLVTPCGTNTPTVTRASRSGASSTNSALGPWRTSTASSRPSSIVRRRCRPEGSPRPVGSSWVLSSCTS